MITAYRSEANRLVPLTETEIGGLIDGLPSDLVWFDIVSPTSDEDKLIEQLLSLSLPTREEMEEIEVSARLYQEDGAEFMTVTAVTRIETEAPETSPITFILKGNVLATIRFVEPRAFSTYIARAQKPGAVACAGGEQIMFALVESQCDRMADALERVGRELDKLSRKVFRREVGEKPSTSSDDLRAIIEKIGRDADLLTKVRESLVSINRLVTYHQTVDAKDKRQVKDARAKAKVLYRDVVALTDQATFLSTKLEFLLDATLGLINIQQTQIIKIFSVAAVVFLPPTLIASIYGMNFEYMPELQWTYGYLWALGIMVVSAILPYVYFRIKGWL
ncbi:MAG: magnesium/cobalt transporter CorA [Hyphomicrobiaceae bacterium]